MGDEFKSKWAICDVYDTSARVYKNSEISLCLKLKDHKNDFRAKTMQAYQSIVNKVQ